MQQRVQTEIYAIKPKYNKLEIDFIIKSWKRRHPRKII